MEAAIVFSVFYSAGLLASFIWDRTVFPEERRGPMTPERHEQLRSAAHSALLRYLHPPMEEWNRWAAELWDEHMRNEEGPRE